MKIWNLQQMRDRSNQIDLYSSPFNRRISSTCCHNWNKRSSDGERNLLSTMCISTAFATRRNALKCFSSFQSLGKSNAKRVSQQMFFFLSDLPERKILTQIYCFRMWSYARQNAWTSTQQSQWLLNDLIDHLSWRCSRTRMLACRIHIGVKYGCFLTGAPIVNSLECLRIGSIDNLFHNRAIFRCANRSWCHFFVDIRNFDSNIMDDRIRHTKFWVVAKNRHFVRIINLFFHVVAQTFVLWLTWILQCPPVGSNSDAR